MLSAKDLKVFGSLKQKKYRESEGKFLIEGFHLIEECLSSSFCLEKIIVNEDVNYLKIENLKKKFGNTLPDITEIPAAQYKKITETENSQGIIGSVRIPDDKKSNAIKDEKLVIALDRINDPGNLGTIIRTSYWFGVDKILSGENSTDIYNSKAIRATQGAIFHSNILRNINLKTELGNYQKSGYNVYLFTLNAEKYLDEIKPADKSVLVFGNESGGISSELLYINFTSVKIRGYTNCESLNAAVSSAIALYHFKSSL